MNNLNISGLIKVQTKLEYLSPLAPDSQDIPFFENNNIVQDKDEHPDQVFAQSIASLSSYPSDLFCNSSHDIMSDSKIDVEERHLSKNVQPPQRMDCEICKISIIDATITPCLHTFCSFCIYEYLQCYDSCPICDSLVTIQKLKPNHFQNKIIFATLKKRKKANFKEKKRINDISRYWKARRLKNLDRDVLIDFKCRQNIWVQAKIAKITFKKKDSSKFSNIQVAVFYSIRDKHFKEYVNGNSARLATLGFFTLRSKLIFEHSVATFLRQRFLKNSKSCASMQRQNKAKQGRILNVIDVSS